MKFACLVLDHDDTVVNSTATVHYPSFVAFLKQYRPDLPVCSLEQYFQKNFHSGPLGFFRDELGLSEAELQQEHVFWDAYVQNHIPCVYAGMRELLWAHKQQGGHICVVSHSMSHNIRRDYRENDLPEPELVFGWEAPEELRKPNPYPLQRIMQELNLRPDQLLMVDDLKPGYDMAKAAGVPFAAAGWSNDIPMIETFMRQNSDYYFKTIQSLREFLEV